MTLNTPLVALVAAPNAEVIDDQAGQAAEMPSSAGRNQHDSLPPAHLAQDGDFEVGQPRKRRQRMNPAPSATANRQGK